MWSKTKEALMERMTYKLKNRVRYNFEVYTTKGYHSKMKVFYIYVDDNVWFASNPLSYSKQYEYIDKKVDRNLPRDEYWKAHGNAWNDSINYSSECGIMNVDLTMFYIHEYLNEYNVKECLDSKNYILKMLAVLDRRIGKRTVKQLVDNISNETEWFRKFIILRAESEGSIII